MDQELRNRFLRQWESMTGVQFLLKRILNSDSGGILLRPISTNSIALIGLKPCDKTSTMKVYQEITPISNADVFILIDSVNKGFDYPIHNHPEYELNLVLGSSGQRIVGDSTERYVNNDLVLIGPYLFHKWDDEDKDDQDQTPCRVVTLQFDMHLFEGPLLVKEPFSGIKRMLTHASRGIQFTDETFAEARDMMLRLTQTSGINSILLFLKLLDMLASSPSFQHLVSVGFDQSVQQTSSKRLHAAYQYIIRHFKNVELRMSDVSDHINLSDSAFSHFFKKETHRSFSTFLIDMRLGHACHLLLDTDDLIAHISYECGFNNLTNFNRLFKKKYLRSPSAWRKMYQHKQDFDWHSQQTPGQFLPSDLRDAPHIQPDYRGSKLMHH